MFNYAPLGELVGCRLRRLGLLVWPDANGLRETDVRLHLEVERDNGTSYELTCSTDSDGQTPCVTIEEWNRGAPVSTLQQRQHVWAEDSFWNSNDGQAYELFETAEEESLGVGVGAVVTEVFVVRFIDGGREPTGIVIEFDNADRIWSAPSASGNCVSANSQNYVWPGEVELVAILT